MTAQPHERFIVGQGESGRMYITHTQTPRFVAELFEDDSDAPLTPLSLALPDSGEVLANFSWIDDPGAHDLHQLRRDIAAFLDEHDFRAECEIDAARLREDFDGA